MDYSVEVLAASRERDIARRASKALAAYADWKQAEITAHLVQDRSSAYQASANARAALHLYPGLMERLTGG